MTTGEEGRPAMTRVLEKSVSLANQRFTPLFLARCKSSIFKFYRGMRTVNIL